MSDDRQRLTQGLDALDLALPEAVQTQLLAFRDLLARWNRTYNLTAVRDPAQMVVRHLFDSLAVAPYLQGERILDVGTGAGLPGVPLALAQPQRHFVLLDSQAKRARFLHQVVIALGIANIEVVQARVEDYQPDRPFDTIVSRAFSRIADFVQLAGRHCADFGVLLAMKGVQNEVELSCVSEPWRVAEIIRLEVPGLAGERHLIRINRPVRGQASDERR